MTALTRSALMEKFRAMAARGEPIVGGGAGTGLSAKCEEAGGVDLIVGAKVRLLVERGGIIRGGGVVQRAADRAADGAGENDEGGEAC